MRSNNLRGRLRGLLRGRGVRLPESGVHVLEQGVRALDRVCTDRSEMCTYWQRNFSGVDNSHASCTSQELLESQHQSLRFFLARSL